MFTAAVAAPSCCAYLYTTNTQNNLGESQAEAENELTCPANSATVTLLPSFLPTHTHTINTKIVQSLLPFSSPFPCFVYPKNDYAVAQPSSSFSFILCWIWKKSALVAFINTTPIHTHTHIQANKCKWGRARASIASAFQSEREKEAKGESAAEREREYAQCSGQTGSGWDEVGGGTVGEELLLLLLLLLVIVVNCCVCVCLCGMRAAKSLTWSPSLSTPAARRFVLKKWQLTLKRSPNIAFAHRHRHRHRYLLTTESLLLFRCCS